MKADVRRLMPTRQDFATHERILEEVAKRRSARFEMATEFFSRKISFSLGVRPFWDWEPAERKHWYGEHPPQDLLGGVVGSWHGLGTPDWPRLQVEDPQEYERHVQDYAQLVIDEAKKQQEAVNGGSPAYSA